MCASKDCGSKKNRNNLAVISEKETLVVSESSRYVHHNGRDTKKSFRRRINTPHLLR